jgi:hypothetical protein
MSFEESQGDSSALSAHKGPGSGGVNGTRSVPGRVDNPILSVQPPRREDLQPSYAQTLVGESEQGNHGWYGSMSKDSQFHIIALQPSLTNRYSQWIGYIRWNYGRIPLLYLLS